MNSLSLIRSHLQRAQRLHNAQLISTAHGSKYHDQSVLNANSAARKERARRLHDAQLMAC